MDFTIFGSSPKYKIGALFVHFSTLMSVIFRIFIYGLHENIVSVLLFQNLNNYATITIKILHIFVKN